MLRPILLPYLPSHQVHCTGLQPQCVICWEALWGRGISWGLLSEAEPPSPPAALLWLAEPVLPGGYHPLTDSPFPGHCWAAGYP